MTLSIHNIYDTLANSGIEDLFDHKGQRWGWQNGFLSRETREGWIIYTEFVRPELRENNKFQTE